VAEYEALWAFLKQGGLDTLLAILDIWTLHPTGVFG
jgi:hypothetical protein